MAEEMFTIRIRWGDHDKKREEFTELLETNGYSFEVTRLVDTFYFQFKPMPKTKALKFWEFVNKTHKYTCYINRFVFIDKKGKEHLYKNLILP